MSKLSQSEIKNKKDGRMFAFQAIYAYEIEQQNMEQLFVHDGETPINPNMLEFAQFLVKGTIDNLCAIDEVIKTKLIKWDFNRLSLIDKSILRLAVFELYFTDVPDVIAINEAVETAKLFGAEDSYKFINGILDAINKTKKQNLKNNQ